MSKVFLVVRIQDAMDAAVDEVQEQQSQANDSDEEDDDDCMFGYQQLPQDDDDDENMYGQLASEDDDDDENQGDIKDPLEIAVAEADQIQPGIYRNVCLATHMSNMLLTSTRNF